MIWIAQKLVNVDVEWVSAARNAGCSSSHQLLTRTVEEIQNNDRDDKNIERYLINECIYEMI